MTFHSKDVIRGRCRPPCYFHPEAYRSLGDFLLMYIPNIHEDLIITLYFVQYVVIFLNCV